jgi:hypothetical protein
MTPHFDASTAAGDHKRQSTPVASRWQYRTPMGRDLCFARNGRASSSSQCDDDLAKRDASRTREINWSYWSVQGENVRYDNLRRVPTTKHREQT